MNDLTVEECLKMAEHCELHARIVESGAGRGWAKDAAVFCAKAEELRQAQEKAKPRRPCVFCGAERGDLGYACGPCWLEYTSKQTRLPATALDAFQEILDRIANAPQAQEEEA